MTASSAWDAADFDPWETLEWDTVRVVRYRQHKPDGTVVQADWLTNLPGRVVGLSLYRIAKSRWEIENEGFNDCKSRQGLEHICHHMRNTACSSPAHAVGADHRTTVPVALPASRPACAAECH